VRLDISSGRTCWRTSAVLHFVECKSGSTAHPSFSQPLAKVRDVVSLPGRDVQKALVYGGRQSHPRRTFPLYSWKDTDRLGRHVAA
jgi:hypothetical protein